MGRFDNIKFNHPFLQQAYEEAVDFEKHFQYVISITNMDPDTLKQEVKEFSQSRNLSLAEAMKQLEEFYDAEHDGRIRKPIV